jgi:hypothetical protein
LSDDLLEASDQKEVVVSIFMILRMQADPNKLEQYATANADVMRRRRRGGPGGRRDPARVRRRRR